MAKDDTPVVKQTLGAYSGLDGQPIEELRDQDVTITKITIERRRFRDDPEAPYAVIVTDNGEVYHTWSAFLIEQLAAIPEDALPGSTVFRKVKTKNNREVWKMDPPMFGVARWYWLHLNAQRATRSLMIRYRIETW